MWGLERRVGNNHQPQRVERRRHLLTGREGLVEAGKGEVVGGNGGKRILSRDHAVNPPNRAFRQRRQVAIGEAVQDSGKALGDALIGHVAVGRRRLPGRAGVGCGRAAEAVRASAHRFEHLVDVRDGSDSADTDDVYGHDTSFMFARSPEGTQTKSRLRQSCGMLIAHSPA